MLTEPTVEKLRTMRLEAMATGYIEQQQKSDSNELSFDERFGLLVDTEYLARENKRLTRRLHEAKLKLSQACVEDIDYPAARNLDKAVIRQLATCSWVQGHQSVLITGLTGTGKSYIACALANQACRKGYRALCCRATRLFDELVLARATGTHARVLGKLARMDVLLLDDWGLKPVSDQERLDGGPLHGADDGCFLNQRKRRLTAPQVVPSTAVTSENSNQSPWNALPET